MILALSLLFQDPALAFGPTGHRIVGTIAESYLCPRARELVDSLLDGQSLATAGLWPDWIRHTPEWENTGPWHYINVADGQTLEEATGGPQGDVLWALARFERQFRDRSLSKRRRANALRFFIHFVADVHQPLHVGRSEDRGGNSVRLSVAGKMTSLHALWDGQALLRMDGGSVRDQVRGMAGILSGLKPQQKQGDPLEWARESRRYLHYVYDIKKKSADGVLLPDARYLAGARRIVKERLALAGVRLAVRLNAAACSRTATRGRSLPGSRRKKAAGTAGHASGR